MRTQENTHKKKLLHVLTKKTMLAYSPLQGLSEYVYISPNRVFVEKSTFLRGGGLKVAQSYFKFKSLLFSPWIKI